MTTVLFACVHNAGRSQMAAAFFNKLADESKALAISAGTHPAQQLHPEVVEAMKEVGIDVTRVRPRAMNTVPLHFINMLVTMGCAMDQCPVAPGVKTEDWPLDDPKGQPPMKVRAIRDEILERVTKLIEANRWGA